MQKLYLKLILSLVVCLSFVNHVVDQEPYFFKDNNQPTNAVFNLFQDSKGFMWLATNKGLFRYDGFEYQLYHSSNQSSVAGSDIQEEFYGLIWYENFDGFLYYVQNDQLHKLNQSEPTGFVSYGITNKHLFVVKIKGVDDWFIQNNTRKKF